jgi:hypothetical protein
MKADFQDFQTVSPMAPPRDLSDRVQLLIRHELNPSPWKVFAKLSGIHFVIGTVTLALCPQFGFRLVGDGMGLMTYFMGLGVHGCMAACGALFVGSSLAAAGLLLKPEEVRVLRQQQVLQLAALSLLSLGAFLMVDAEILVGFAFAWALGSLLGGALMLELSWGLRKRVQFA